MTPNKPINFTVTGDSNRLWQLKNGYGTLIALFLFEKEANFCAKLFNSGISETEDQFIIEKYKPTDGDQL